MASGSGGHALHASEDTFQNVLQPESAITSTRDAIGSDGLETGSELQNFIGVWKKFHLNIVIETKSATSDDKREVSTVLVPLHMQYILKHCLAKLEAVVLKKYELKVGFEVLNVTMKDPTGIAKFDNVVDELIDLLETMKNEIITRQLLGGQGRKYFESVKTVLDTLMKDGNVDLFLDCGKTTVIVGKKENVFVAMEKLKSCRGDSVPGDTVSAITLKLDCPAHAEILCRLAFVDEVRRKWKNNEMSLKINQSDQSVVIMGITKENREKVENEISTFLSSVKMKSVEMEKCQAKLIMTDAVQEYIYEKMSLRDIHCYLHTKSADSILVYARTEELIQKGIKILEECVGTIKVPRNLTDNVKYQDIYKQNSKKINTKLENDDGHYMIVAATDDVLSQIRHLFEKSPTNLQEEEKYHEIEISLNKVHMDLLLMFENNFKNYFLQRHKEVFIHLDSERGRIVFQGHKNMHNEYEKCVKGWFDENKYASERICQPIIVEFYHSSTVEEYIRSQLKSENLDWRVDEKGYLHTLTSDPNKALKMIKSSVKEVQLDGTLKKHIDSSVDFMEKMQRYGDKAKIYGSKDNFVLVGTDDIFRGILEELSHFKEEPKRNATHSVEGCTKYMVGKWRALFMYRNMKKEIKEIESTQDVKISMSCDSKSLIIEGSKESRIIAAKALKMDLNTRIYVSKNSLLIDAGEEKSVKEKISKLPDPGCQIEVDICEREIQFQKCWIQDRGFCRIIQVSGHVADIKTEVLFCPTNGCFIPLGEGWNILLKGGKPILFNTQEHSKKIVTKDGPQKLKTLKDHSADSVFISTETGHLPCNFIVYGVVTRKNMSPEKQIPRCIAAVFEQCENIGCRTVAFSIDASDEFGCDHFPQLVVNAIVQEIRNLKNVEEIYLCCMKDSILKATEKILDTSLSKDFIEIDFSTIFPSSILCTKDMDYAIKGIPVRVSNIIIELDTNGLCNQKVDMLVNTVSPDLNLSVGTVSKVLLKAGGKSIQEECRTKYPHGINLGQVITSAAGKLQCKKLCHGALTEWCFNGVFSLNMLKLFVLNCLFKAEKYECASIGFPSLGTGKLKYPYQQVASVMYDCIQEYGWRNPETCIQKVIFILHPGDNEVLQAFKAVFAAKDQVRKIEQGIGIDGKILATWIHSNYQTVQIQVMPSSCVKNNAEAVVLLDLGQKPDSQASKQQPFVTKWTEGGQLEIALNKLDINACLNILLESRICSAEFIFTGIAGNNDVKTAVKEIKRAIHGYKNHTYLTHVYIALSDSSFKCVAEHEKNKQNKHKAEKAKGWLEFIWPLSTEKVKPPKWQFVHLNKEPQERDKDIIIIGCDKDQVDKCRDEIMKVLDPQKELDSAVNDLLQNETEETVPVPPRQSIPRESAEGARDTPPTRWYTVYQGHKEPIPNNICDRLDAALKNRENSLKICDTDGVEWLYDLKYMTCKSGPDYEVELKQNRDILEVDSTRSEVKYSSSRRRILSKVSAEVNPGILHRMTDVAKVDLNKQLQSRCNVKIIPSKTNCIKIEGSCLENLQKAASFLENFKINEKHTGDDVDDDGDYHSFEIIENEVKVNMSRKDFDILMYFWGNNYEKTNQVKIEYKDNSLVIQIREGLEQISVEEEVEKQRSRITGMTTAEIPFKKEELSKVQSCLPSLRSEYQNVFFYIDNDKFVMLAIGDYTYAQKQTITHRAKILSGQIQETKTRRNRRFGAGDDIEIGQKGSQPDSDEFKSLPGSLPSYDASNSSTRQGNRNFEGKKKFTTREGIDVYVYSQSILQLDVDCIVNAANERLSHGAGVAAAIARAAGYELEQECRAYISNNGSIPVGTCCSTTAGKLPYRYVIHTVGPIWNRNGSSYEQKQCKADLKNAIESCFEEADTLEMRSIGVPSVSAGIFGMPGYLCAEQYCKAVISYSQRRLFKSSATLKEIHFIDSNADMCMQIETAFSKCGDLTETGASTGNKPTNISHGSRHSFSNSSYSSSFGIDEQNENLSNRGPLSEELVYNPCKWITIHLLESSITDVKDVTAVVSPENLGFKKQGRISKDIMEKADEDYIESFNLLKQEGTSITQVEPLECTEGMPWKFIFYAIAPRWNLEYTQNNQKFEKDLKDTVENILKKAQMRRVKSLAIPLLGTAVQGEKTPMKTCCQAILDGIWSIINKETRSKNWSLDLWIVTTDFAAIHTLKEMLNTRAGPPSSSSQEDLKSSKLQSQKTDLNEDCCICLDKISDPKWLSCKHVFCRDCIDQQFTFKPACPQCGAVHGIVTGDQPPGEMTTRIQNFNLPGYPRCKTIAVTYSFPSGYQTEEHPNPGKFYTGIERTGYLPDNKRGRLVADLLKIAFDRRLVFTIGRSRTTGHEGVITWNDIHHKTKTHGGQQSFGYPDDTYLDRVLDELSAKGVTEDSINE